MSCLYIPPSHIKIRIHEVENKYWYVIEKICDILFSSKYNQYCITTARSILDFCVKARFITGKQIKLILNLTPNKY